MGTGWRIQIAVPFVSLGVLVFRALRCTKAGPAWTVEIRRISTKQGGSQNNLESSAALRDEGAREESMV